MDDQGQPERRAAYRPSHVFLVKCDSFVSFENRSALADKTVAMSNVGGHMPDFIADCFAPMHTATKFSNAVRKNEPM